MDPPNIDGLTVKTASAFNMKKRGGGWHVALQHIDRVAELEINRNSINYRIN